MKISPKKMALMAASAILMLLSNMVDNKLSEEDLRQMVKEEVEREKNS